MEKRIVLRQTPTFSHFITERYLPFIRGYKRSWWKDESLLRNHLLRRLGRKHLDQITMHDIHQGTCAAGAAPASAWKLFHEHIIPSPLSATSLIR